MTKFSALPTEYAEIDLDSVKDYLFITRIDTANASARSQLAELRNWITANATKLSVSSGTLTASTPINITQTWNSGATTFDAFRITITDTASASGFGIRVFGGVNGTTNLFRVGSTGLLETVNVLTTGYVQGTTVYVGGSSDVRLYRDAANSLALRNSTNAQSLAVYETYTDASNYSRLRLYGTAGGSHTIASEAAGTGTVRDVVIATGGTTRLTLASTGNTFTGGVSVGGTSWLGWSSRSFMYAPSSGVIALYNSSVTDFNRLQFGGTTSSFPAIKRSSATLQARLADDSAFADFACANLALADAKDITIDSTTGSKIGQTTSKVAFYGSTPVTQQVLATGASATVDDVITLLQTLGLCKQA